MVLFSKLKGEREVPETQTSELYEFHTFGKLLVKSKGEPLGKPGGMTGSLNNEINVSALDSGVSSVK